MTAAQPHADTPGDRPEAGHSVGAPRRSDAPFRAICDALPLGIFLTDRNGDCAYANPACLRLSGLTFGQALGRGWRGSLHPDDRERFFADWEAAGQQQKPYETATRYLRPDGTAVWISVRALPLYENAGFLGYLGIVEDLTERKQAEEAVRASEKKLRRITDAVPGAVYQYRLMPDGSQSFQFMSGGATELLGITEEEAMRDFSRVWNLMLPDDRAGVAASIEHSAMTLQPWTYEFRIRKPDGQIHWLRGSSVPEPPEADGSIVWNGLLVDISEERRLEEALRQSQKMEAVGRLAGGIAHDFNNLLTAVMGHSDLLLRRLPADDPSYRHASEIQRASERAAALTQQLLAFSRRQVLQPKVLDLNVVVLDVVKMLQRLIGEDIELATRLDPSLGLVKADPGQLQQVVVNLAVNARDAMPQGGVLTIETRNVDLGEAETRGREGAGPGPYVQLVIRDTGVGMDDETQAHLFEPFFTTKEVGKGTGLGLAMVYGIIRQSEGFIAVESRPRSGTAFRVSLPQLARGAQAENSGASSAEPRAGTETVLVVEDEPSVRELVRTVLRAKGYRVLEAGTGEEALRVCEEATEPIHLVLTDVVMPGMSGRVLAERLVAARPGVKVLFMSGYTEDAVVRHGLETNGAAFIQKPFSPGLLSAKVRELLDAAS